MKRWHSETHVAKKNQFGLVVGDLSCWTHDPRPLGRYRKKTFYGKCGNRHCACCVTERNCKRLDRRQDRYRLKRELAAEDA